VDDPLEAQHVIDALFHCWARDMAEAVDEEGFMQKVTQAKSVLSID
jgi:hypothetical protein